MTGPSAPVTWAGSLPTSYTIGPAFGTPQTVSYGYDSLGRVQRIGWSWIPTGSFGIEYHPNGQYSRITFPNGQSRVFSYDNQGRLTSLANNDVSGSALALFQYDYDYDWATGTNTMLGPRTSMTVTAVPGTNLEIGQTKYQYDSRYQLTRADRPTVSYDTWTYDAIGNRTASRFATYTYYKNGQNPLNGARLRSNSGSPDLAYDANGNMTGYVISPNMYTWNYAGQIGVREFRFVYV